MSDEDKNLFDEILAVAEGGSDNKGKVRASGSAEGNGVDAHGGSPAGASGSPARGDGAAKKRGKTTTQSKRRKRGVGSPLGAAELHRYNVNHPIPDEDGTEEGEVPAINEDELGCEFGPDLYRDEDDRMQLMGMPEIERERILAERGEMRQRMIERLELKKKLSRNSAAANPQNQAGKNKSALEDMKRRRQAQNGKRRREHHEDDSTEQSSEEEESSASESSSTKRRKTEHAKPEAEKEPSEKIKLSDARAIQITRDMLEKWCFSGFFANTITGAFVRLAIGSNSAQQVYRLCEVRAVQDYHRDYFVGRTRTNKALLLRHGQAEKVFLMDIISNSPVSEQELNRYHAVMDVAKIPLLTPDAIAKTKKCLEKARNYAYSEREIDLMVQEKRKIAQRHNETPRNIAVEKTNLMLQLHKEEAAGNAEAVAKIEARLEQIEDISDKKWKWMGESAVAQTLAKVGERNREANLQNKEKVELADMRKKYKYTDEERAQFAEEDRLAKEDAEKRSALRWRLDAGDPEACPVKRALKRAMDDQQKQKLAPKKEPSKHMNGLLKRNTMELDIDVSAL